MAKQIQHIGKRSWWDGSAKTLCGLKILKPDMVWFPSLSSSRTCPACLAAEAAGRQL